MSSWLLKPIPVAWKPNFPTIIQTHLASTYSPEDTEFSLRPLADIHLHSKSGEELAVNGDLGQLKFLGIMAGLILLLSHSQLFEFIDGPVFNPISGNGYPKNGRGQ